MNFKGKNLHKIKERNGRFHNMKSRILCICSTAAVMGGVLLFTGCATSIEDDRLPPGAYVPPAPKQNPPPQVNTPPVKGGVDDVEPAVQPQAVITPVNEQLPPPPPKRVEKRVKNDKKVIHVVQRGDSFWKLASMYGVTVKEIMDANPGVAPNKIYPGKKIVIPASGSGKKAVSAKPAAKSKKTAAKADKKVKKTTVKASAPGERYTVRKGDSFGKIAAKYKIKAADLATANKLSLEKPLWIGQVLIIPQNAEKTAKANKKAAAPAAAKGKKSAAKTQKTTAKGKKAAAKKAQSAPAKAPADAKENEPQPPAAAKSADSKDSLPPAPVAPPDLSDLNEPAAPQKKEASAADAKPLPAQTTDVIKEDISLDAYAKKVGFSVESLKQYNPNLPADGMIRAGTVMNLP